MTVTITPRTDMVPVPRVELVVEVADVPAGTNRITLWRVADKREFKVRGGVDRSMVASVSLIDYEAPFGVVSSYEAECFDGDATLGRVALGSTTLTYEGTVVQQPLDPSLAAVVILKDGTAASSLRPVPGEPVFPENTVLPSFIGFGPRRGLVDFPLNFDTHELRDASMMQDMLGTYDTPQLPVLLMRTSLPARLPRVLFFDGSALVERDVDVQYGGTVVNFTATVVELAPPAPGLVVASLSYDDLDAAYGSYDERDAAYPSYDAMDRDYSLAGIAG